MTFANIHIKVPPEVAVLEPDGGTTVGEESGARCDNTVVGTGGLKTRDLTSREWTTRHHIARVDIAAQVY